MTITKNKREWKKNTWYLRKKKNHTAMVDQKEAMLMSIKPTSA